MPSKCGRRNHLRMVVFLPDIACLLLQYRPTQAVQRHQTANRVLRDDRAERTGRIRQRYALRRLPCARAFVRARPSAGRRRFLVCASWASLAAEKNNRSREAALRSGVRILRERKRALRLESVSLTSRMVKSTALSTKTDVFSFHPLCFLRYLSGYLQLYSKDFRFSQ